MTRFLLCLAIVAMQLTASQQADCRPPDQVPHSSIPPLQRPPQQGANNGTARASLADGDDAAAEQIRAFDPGLLPQKAPNSLSRRNSSTSGSSAEQLKIWTSPAMREARDAVMEFCRRSRQTSPAEGEQFLERLSQLPPDEMRDWLERYQERKASISRAQDAARRARQIAVDQAVRKREQVQQAAADAAELRGGGAVPAAQRFLTGPHLEPSRYLPFGGAKPFGPPSYNPLEPVFDPMSPRGYRRRVAAAMSLPGDLPPSDPRNFIRGEAGVDFGEWATTREAVPPIPPITAPPAPVVPSGPAEPADGQ